MFGPYQQGSKPRERRPETEGRVKPTEWVKEAPGQCYTGGLESIQSRPSKMMGGLGWGRGERTNKLSDNSDSVESWITVLRCYYSCNKELTKNLKKTINVEVINSR